MQVTAATSSDATSLHVLLVCARGEHLQRVRTLASRWPQAAFVHWTPDPDEALRRAHAHPPHLAIVDARLDRFCQSTLSERLRRVSPQLVVMHFDEPCSVERRAGGGHWHWSELAKATGWWVQRHCGAAPAPGATLPLPPLPVPQ